MLVIKEYLKQTRTVLVTQDAFDELVKKASAQPESIRCRECKCEEPEKEFKCTKDKTIEHAMGEFKVGDEVLVDTHDGKLWKGVVLESMVGEISGIKALCAYDHKVRHFCIHCVVKTGRHFDEVDQLLLSLDD